MNKTGLVGGIAMAAALAMVIGLGAGTTEPARAGSAMPSSADAMKAADTMPAAKDGKMDRAQVEAIIRDYLLKNPEILLDVQNALEAKQKEEQKIASEGVIKSQKDAIFNSTYDGVAGNPNGKTTIVEFYDYNCGFCKRAIEDMQALTKSDPDLRFVLKEFPILSADSQKASIVSMAFHKMMPEKYAEFHTKLLGGEGRANESRAVKLALSLGADEATLRQHMKDPDIQKALQQTYDLANKLSITGTPSYVVGNEVIFGALGQQVLAEKIQQAKDAAL